MTTFLQLVITGLIVGSLYAIVGATVVLIFKATQVLSLAQGSILAMGALFFWFAFVTWELPFWLSLLLAIVFAAIMGAALERFTMRPLIGQSLFAAFFMTVAISLGLDGVLALILKGVGRVYPPFLPAGKLSFAGITIPLDHLTIFGVVLLLFFLVALFFRYTKAGLGMRATSEDHQLAQSTGISVKFVFSAIWVMAAVLATVGGIGIASVMGIHFFLPAAMIIKGVVAALFGGLDSLPGVLLGGLALGVFENITAGYLDPFVGGGFKDAAAYIMLLFILLVRPYGLFGLVRIERI